MIATACAALAVLTVAPLAASANLGIGDSSREAPGADSAEPASHHSALALDEQINLRLDKVLTTAGPYLAASPVSYTVTVTNDGPGTAQPGWVIADLVPFALTNPAATLAGSLCERNTDGSPTGSVFRCVGATALAPGQSATVLVTATVGNDAEPGAAIANVAYVMPAPGDEETNPLVEPDGATDTAVTPTDNDARAVLTVAPPTFDLALVKVVDRSAIELEEEVTAQLGSDVPYRIVVRNQGTTPAAFTVTDLLPAGMGLAPGSQSFETAPVDVVPVVVGRTLTWTVGAARQLAPGAQVALTYRGRVTSVTGITEFRNRAEISADNAASYGAAIRDEDSTPDANLDDDAVIDRTSVSALDIDNDPADSDDHDIAVVRVAPPVIDLALIKTASPTAAVPVGAPVTFTLTVSNAATCGLTACAPAAGVVITDKLPDGFRYLSDSGGGAYNATSGTWAVPGTIAAGGEARLAITATAVAAGTVRNAAQVTSAALGDVDSTPANADDSRPAEDDESAVSVLVTMPAVVGDLAVVGDIQPGSGATGAPYRYGDTVRLSVTITNHGPDTATGATVATPLPVGFDYVGDDSGGSFDPTGLWIIGDLPARAARTILITAVVDTSGPWTLAPALADHDQIDSDPANNTDLDSIVPAPLSIGNRVWIDVDNDGLQDPDEPAAVGVPVRLVRPDGTVMRTAATSATGHYLFSELSPGEYAVEITAPAGYVSSTGPRPASAYEPAPDPDGNLDLDDNGTAAGSTIRSALVTLRGGEPVGEPVGTSPDTATDADSNLTVDFGLFEPAALSGVVWRDTDADGTPDVGEFPLGGVTVVVRDAASAVVAQVATAADGSYRVADLSPGGYTVEIAQTTLPASHVPTSDFDGVATPHRVTTTVAAGQVRTGVNFGYRLPPAPAASPPSTAAAPVTSTTSGQAPSSGVAVAGLQVTGSNSASLVLVALLLVGAGFTLIGVGQLARRR